MEDRQETGSVIMPVYNLVHPGASFDLSVIHVEKCSLGYATNTCNSNRY